MYVWLSKYPLWITITLGVGTAAVACKILWSFGRKICASNGKVLDVLIFNELSGYCDANHNDNYGDGDSRCTNKYCTKRNIKKIVQLINRAKYSIDIAMYTFTLSELKLALEQALQRGVQLRVISDHEMTLSSNSQIGRLNELGIEVRAPKTSAMMHHKFLVIDGRQRLAEIFRGGKSVDTCSLVLTGSANWTMQGVAGNWELCIISSDSVMTAKYEEEFFRMWEAFENSTQNFPKISSTLLTKSS